MKSTLLSIVCSLIATGLAHAQTGRMIAVDSSRALFEVDISTGAKTSIGTVSSNAGTTGGLAYDCATGTLYLTSSSLDSLFTLDLATGTATLVGAYGDSSVVMQGLEWDNSTGTLYGGSAGNLYLINHVTGLATLIGASGSGNSFFNLGYDRDANILYATQSANDTSYIVDRATGVATPIGLLNPSGGNVNPNGMAYVPHLQKMFIIDNNTDSLYTLNTTTGAYELVGVMGTGNLLGLAWVTDGCGDGSGGCNLADITETGGTLEEPGAPDGQLTLDDILVFIDAYNDATGCPGTAPCNLADITESGGTLEEPGTPDGQLTLDDILVFVDAYNEGCV